MSWLAWSQGNINWLRKRSPQESGFVSSNTKPLSSFPLRNPSGRNDGPDIEWNWWGLPRSLSSIHEELVTLRPHEWREMLVSLFPGSPVKVERFSLLSPFLIGQDRPFLKTCKWGGMGFMQRGASGILVTSRRGALTFGMRWGEIPKQMQRRSS